MAAFFIVGENKVRPGVYFNYKNHGEPPVAGADDGVCAAVFRSDWGPVGRPVLIEQFEDIEKVFGGKGTMDVPLEQFRGGARSVYCVRLGNGSMSAQRGQYAIMDATGATVITLTLKYPGSREFLITIRPTLEAPAIGELLLLDGTELLERFYFPNVTVTMPDPLDPNYDPATPLPETPVSALVATVVAQGSAYFTLTKAADNGESLMPVDQEAITPRTDPIITGAAYSAAFESLEAYRWNVLSIDTVDSGVQSLMKMYLNRVYRGGKFVMGVIGEGRNVPFDTRLAHATACNDYQIVFVGNGFIDQNGKEYEGYLAAARIAGLIAGTPSYESITHLAISGAVDLTEPSITDSQYQRAIKAGMLTFSMSSANIVWVEQGINSLALGGAKDDDGWKKIKRVKVRFELMQRLNDTIENLVGRVNNDEDGRLNIIQASNRVCTAMMAEHKLLPGSFVELDDEIAPRGDSAWFKVYADDIDALEKMYFTFMFRFAPDTLTN